MRLLRILESGELSFTDDLVEDELPSYAILSHRWFTDAEEPTFADLLHGRGKQKLGYKKLQFCGEQAQQDGMVHFWVDTCCIDKDNQAELSHAIKCMFRWYQKARVCYVYLWDVSDRPTNSNILSDKTWSQKDWRKSTWFTRAWTLQELLAPQSVKFFDREAHILGDKRSLERPLHEATAIPESALRGAPLTRFTVQERLSWTTTRKASLEEDKAYSLLGIFDVDIAPLYGPGTGQAFDRLMSEIDRREKCIRDLGAMDPRHDKSRIEATKGGLLDDCYRWILKNEQFQQWRGRQQERLLWIRGDPGKGKTMLVCGIINELEDDGVGQNMLSFFFCQAGDHRINNASAVLKGLLYLLVVQRSSLASHLQEEYDRAGKRVFEDANAWVALSKVFLNILQDLRLETVYLVIDGLDECVEGLDKLLGLVSHTSVVCKRAKWVVSSRNWPRIEEGLGNTEGELALSLEINAHSVSEAVRSFINHRMLRLAQRKKYDGKTQAGVSDYLYRNADGTFLWVALVCQDLEKTPRWDALAKVVRFPPGLDALYERMLEQVMSSDHAELCRSILATVAAVYRPVTLTELTALIAMITNLSDDLEAVKEIVGLCGSFLTVREDTVGFVHLSVKDFLFEKAFDRIFPSGIEVVHREFFLRSVHAMDKMLKRDIYNLNKPGYPIAAVERPNPDPLAIVRYSCLHWIDHFSAWKFVPNEDGSIGLSKGVSILEDFFRTRSLHWLEALALCGNVPEGVISMAKLEDLLQVIIRRS